ncbi:MAG: hypothetical protein GF353_16005 [Candidatus Lokiarchaeota archaeon]|nr:hypothetical protein [Candidatus Lokiarchaeota archaeon]MBD3352301.1 hypothetical protein [Candidatus Lokiarchaeota archaeon]
MDSQKPIKGISVGSKAPIFDTEDIDNKKINLRNLLEQYSGVLLDFFRGAW